MPSDLLGVRVEEERDALPGSPPRRKLAPEPEAPSVPVSDGSPRGGRSAPSYRTTREDASPSNAEVAVAPPPRPGRNPERRATIVHPVAAQTPDHGRARAYDELEASASGGLDPASLRDAASKYTIDEQTLVPAPLPYDVPNGVRLLCTAIEGPDGGDDLRDALARACERFIDALPTGWIVHRNPPRSYHSTVFHTGHPTDPRPPRDAYDLAFEVREATQLVGGTTPIPVEVDRVVVASSGVLLALLRHPGGGESPVDGLRARCRRRWPGAPQRQATHVMHVSLCRVLRATPQCDGARWGEVLVRVREVSAELAGMRAQLGTVWHVQEKMQMTCGDEEAGCVVKRLRLGKDLK